MDLQESHRETTFRAEVRAFVHEHLPADIRDKVLKFQHLDKDDYIRWYHILNERGWSAPSWPVEYGGPGWTGIERTIFEMECMSAGAPRLLSHIGMIGPVLIRYGTAWQKDWFLPRTRALEILWCQGYSEPGAGSDLASLTTSAVRRGDTYVVNGQKIWTSLSHWADWIFALVRTSQAGRPQEGISFLLIDLNSAGITRRPIKMLNGATELTEVFFANVEVPVENLVHQENMGWTVAKFLLGYERTVQADIGLCMRMLRRLKEVARVQSRRGHALINDNLFRSRIVDLETKLLAHEWTLMRTLSQIAKGQDVGAGTHVLKLAATEIVQEATALLMECAGPDVLPYVEEALHAQWQGDLPNSVEIHTLAANYLDWRKIGIYGGTTEVIKNIMGKLLAGS